MEWLKRRERGEANDREGEVVTASPRSAGQTGADKANVFLLRCAELLNRQREERPANIGLPDRLWINQSVSQRSTLCVCVCMCKSLILVICNTLPAAALWC